MQTKFSRLSTRKPLARPSRCRREDNASLSDDRGVRSRIISRLRTFVFVNVESGWWERMSFIDRKSSFSVGILALLASLLFVHSLARGDDRVKAMKEVVVTQPATTIEHEGDLNGEILSARMRAKEDPSNASVHVRLADLLVRKGAFDEAMLSFDEALKLNPHAHEAKTGRGVVLARQGNLQEAQAVLKDALILNPNPVRAHYELGLVYEKLGDLEKAIAEFKEGIRKHEQGR
jgi:tetratricopeptide (TPR) repeat protein